VLEVGNPFPHGLFWTDILETPMAPAVADLLAAAQAKGVNAHYVPVETFDTLMLRLWRNTPGKPEALDAKVRKARLIPAHIVLPPPGEAPSLLRLNALPLTVLPKECLAVSFAAPKEWADLRTAGERANHRLILSKTTTILCWGPRSALKEGFGEEPKSVDTFLLPTDLGAPDNLTIKRFVEDGLCAALVRGKPLLTRSTRNASFLIAQRQDATDGLARLRGVVGTTTGVIAGLFTLVDDEHPDPEQVAWAEAMRVSIDVKNGQVWMVVDPDIWIWPHRATELATDFLSKRRRDRRNPRYNAILDAWIRLLVGSPDLNAEATVTAFTCSTAPENPAFTFGSRSAFARRSSE